MKPRIQILRLISVYTNVIFITKYVQLNNMYMCYSSLTFIYYRCLFDAQSFRFFCKNFIIRSMKSVQCERFCASSIFRIHHCHTIINTRVGNLILATPRQTGYKCCWSDTPMQQEGWVLPLPTYIMGAIHHEMGIRSSQLIVSRCRDSV